MAATGKKNEPAKKANEKLQEKPEDKSKKKPPADEDEDGDIATPKRDRYGADDEPL